MGDPEKKLKKPNMNWGIVKMKFLKKNIIINLAILV